MVFLPESSSSAVASPSSDSTLNGSVGKFPLELLADSLSGEGELRKERGGTKKPCGLVFSLPEAEESGDCMRTVLVLGTGGTSAEY